MARDRSTHKSSHTAVESGEEFQESLGEGETAQAPIAVGAKFNKSQAARAALAEGIDSPEDAVEFIKRRFGIVMGRQHFSAVKSQMKKKQGDTTAANPSALGRRGTSRAYAIPKVLLAADGQSDVLGALEAIKGLVDRFGAEKVKRMVDLLE